MKEESLCKQSYRIHIAVRIECSRKSREWARDHCKSALRFCGQRKGTSRRYIHD